jgi:ABC-type polar amino acid transport system ATPase subunit
MRWTTFAAAISLACNSLQLDALSSGATGTSDVKSSWVPRLIPSKIGANRLTQSYTETLFSKLFSSVPKREFAIRDVSLDFGWQSSEDRNGLEGCNLGLTLLVGRSASGKSSLLRIVSGQETPLYGTLTINGQHIYNEKDSEQKSARPVIIDSKPHCYDDQFTVLDRIVKTSCKSLSLPKDESMNILQDLAREFAITLGLTKKQLSGNPSQLNPSGQYLFGLSCACMESSCSAVNLNMIEDMQNQKEVEISCPILLLDELMDAEHSDIAKSVGKGLLRLTARGAIVIAATHRPQHFSGVADRVVTLSSGKVLLQDFPNTRNVIE